MRMLSQMYQVLPRLSANLRDLCTAAQQYNQTTIMKGTQQQQLIKFLTELHDDQQFEVLSAPESKEVKTPT